MLKLGSKQVDKLTGVQKSAILLVCLGEEAAAKIFEGLADSEVQAISRCMMDIEHVPKDMLLDVLREYDIVGKEDSGVLSMGTFSSKGPPGRQRSEKGRSPYGTVFSRW